MSKIIPFQAIRPSQGLAQQIAALPYDVVSSEEARIIAENNPLSFLHIDKAEIDLEPSISPYDDAVYVKAKENLDRLRKNGHLVQDERPCLYIYSLTMNDRTQNGLVACASVDEYVNGGIKKHELTLEKKEQDRIRHVDTCNAHTGPIFLTYRPMDSIAQIIEQWKSEHSPVFDYMEEDGIGHAGWVIDDPEIQTRLSTAFAEVPALYIADGHHRAASAVKVGLLRRTAEQAPDPDALYNFFLSVLFPSNELKILDYNRVVRDLNGHTKEDFLLALAQDFIVEPLNPGAAINPQAPKQYGMYLDGQWYRLAYRGTAAPASPVDNLDVSVLGNTVLTPILGIGDIRTDTRIHFVGGIRGTGELEKMVDSGEYAVAFALHPTSIDEVMEIADQGLIMPPKSTWFEPKLRSGLFIHSLEANE